LQSTIVNNTTAILLCGGKGERLRPFTDELPKPLVPLKGQPLLAHLLQYMSLSGIVRFLVCVGYKADAIESFLNEYRQPSWELTLVNSGDASMTDRLIDARVHLSNRALICYGDTLANVDLPSLLNAHEQSGALATITIHPLHSPFGIVETFENGRVRSFQEKPQLPYWINIGFIVCEPKGFDYLQRGWDMPRFLSTLAGAGELNTYRHSGKHVTVNTEKERLAAEAEMIEFYTYMDGQMK
jgi:glucose-1-phosphate cytidylyltransferase